MHRVDEVPGYEEVVGWFGYFPSFHDSVLFEAQVNLAGPSQLKLHAWNTLSDTDKLGFFETEIHAVVELTFDKTQELKISSFDNPSIIFELSLKHDNELSELSWTSSYGAEGVIKGRGLKLRLLPGKPVTSK